MTLGVRAPFGIRGEVDVAKFGRDGKRVPVRVDRGKRAWQRVWDHRQPNLITNAGMDYGMGGATDLRFRSLIVYVAVGTGSAAPAVTDTALGNEVARTNSSLGLGIPALTVLVSEGEGYYQFVRAFDYGEGNGNLTEFGGAAGTVASAPTILTRNLFLDELSNPVTIVKTPDEQLRITYRLFSQVNDPVAMTPTTAITFTGLGTFSTSWMSYPDAVVRPYSGIGTPATAFPAGLFAFTPAVSFVSPTKMPTVYSAAVLSSSPAVGSVPDGGGGLGGFLPYVGGSYERDVEATWPTTAVDGVAEGFVLGRSLPGAVQSYWGWMFTSPTSLTKEAEYRLTVNATVSVART